LNSTTAIGSESGVLAHQTVERRVRLVPSVVIDALLFVGDFAIHLVLEEISVERFGQVAELDDHDVIEVLGHGLAALLRPKAFDRSLITGHDDLGIRSAD